MSNSINDQLPTEILFHTFSFLTLKDSRICASVCKLWKEIFNSNSIVFHLYQTLGRMIPWDAALEGNKAMASKCLAVSEKVFSTKGEIKGTVTGTRYLYVLTEKKVKQQYQNVFYRILHGRGTIESCLLPTSSSLTCLEKFEENFYCCSIKAKEVFKFSFDGSKITILQTSVMNFDFMKIGILDENRILVLKDSLTINKQCLLLRDLTKGEDSDQSFEVPNFTIDFQYSNGDIWSVHKRIQHNRSHPRFLGITICRTSIKDSHQEEAKCKDAYGRLSSTQPGSLRFCTKDGSGTISPRRPASIKDCIEQGSIQICGMRFEGAPLADDHIFSDFLGETIITATNKEIFFYDSNNNKNNIAIKNKKPIISHLPLKKIWESLKNGQEDLFNPKHKKKVLQGIDNFFFYTCDKERIDRYFLIPS